MEELAQLEELKLNDYDENVNDGMLDNETDTDTDSDSGVFSNNYKLVGIVVHSGQANGGHYYSFIQRKSGEVGQERSMVLFLIIFFSKIHIFIIIPLISILFN